MMPMLMFRIVPTILLLAFFPSCAVSQMNPPNFSTHTFSVRQDEGLNTDSLKINLLKPLGIRRSSVIVPPDGWMFNYENMLMWGLRARIQQQYSYNGTHVVADRNVTCAYLWVDEDVQTLPFSSAGIYSSQYKTYPNRLYLRWWGGLDETNIPPNFFEWLMNATIFIDRKSSFCQNVAGFNVSWSLEYRYSQFSFITSKYLSQMNETCTYDDYNPKSNVLFVTERMSMHDEQEVLEYTSMENYPSGEMDKPSGWLCGRGAGNGTWYWDCGPMQGMAFNYTNWAPGEPSIPDGCLFTCGSDCSLLYGRWYSYPCTHAHRVLLWLDWKNPNQTLFGYIHYQNNNTVVHHKPRWVLITPAKTSVAVCTDVQFMQNASVGTSQCSLQFRCTRDCVDVTEKDFSLPCFGAVLMAGGLSSSKEVMDDVIDGTIEVLSVTYVTVGMIIVNVTLGRSSSFSVLPNNVTINLANTSSPSSSLMQSSDCIFVGNITFLSSLPPAAAPQNTTT
eukprot:PhF_6_TR36479/c0_g1_i4/m.53579